jgi:Ca2+/H+ antiporter, TMEM165/GDT1 family
MILAAASSQTTSLVGLLIAVFAASLVEMVEALTIIVAVGATRGWRSAFEGAVAAVGVLGILVGGGGVALVRYTPIDTLRVIAGSVLLLLGLSWLRKAILRSAGFIALHDEDAIYARTVSSLSAEGARSRIRDTQGFVVAFKGVFIEGMEVVLIVIGLGASQHRIGWAALAAGAAALLVAGVGALVVRQLSEVPENLLKTIVGVMLTSFGTFWIGEGAGVRWPGSDIALVVFVAGFALLTVLLIAWTRRSVAQAGAAKTAADRVVT